jgi:signal transduction histidine kinase
MVELLESLGTRAEAVCDSAAALAELMVNGTVGDLYIWKCLVAAETTGEAVGRFLHDYPELPGVIVVGTQDDVRVVSRRHYLEQMTTIKFAREVYLTRPITVLAARINIADRMVVTLSDRIDDAARQALDRPGGEAYEPLLVEYPDGDYGLLSFDLLLRAQSRILLLAFEEKEQLLSEIKAYADTLTSTLEELRSTQSHLVESQKMASLGQLVAGVAHEINTPIGVALTAASHLRDRTSSLKEIYAQGAMRRSDFQRFVDTVVDSTGMVHANIKQAADLIQSFKQIAADQTGEKIREFNLKSFLDQLLLGLSPQLKKNGEAVRVSCEDDIRMRSFPGPLGQVVTNLVMNALTHAFQLDDIGRVRISATEVEGFVQLRVADDGVGMSEDILAKIYDPFFTTRRGVGGGAGLGLHMVFNLVTKTLQGRITCASQPGRGTTFTVSLPAAIPVEGFRGDANPEYDHENSR